MSAHYYQILGIDESASIDEIKRAFRSRAKDLHPDRNPRPEAQQQFIDLTEAYEFAIAAKTNRYKRYTSPFENAEKQRQQERAEAIKRAQAYARMRYEEFEKTEAFQTISALNIILDHFIFLFACTLLLAVPVALTYFYTITGFILGLLFLLSVARPILGFIKPYFKPAQLWLALMSLVETFFFRIVILSLTNIYLLLRIGLQTMIPLNLLPLLYIGPIAIFYFLVYRKKESNYRLFNSLCIVPLVVNAFFLINFWFSRNPVVEVYEFWNKHERTNNGQRKNTLIHLENEAYDDYAGIRVFSNIDQMKYSTHIVYQFEDGLFGIRVMTDYRFIE